MPTSLIAIDDNVDAAGENVHVQRLVELRLWAEPLQLPKGRFPITSRVAQRGAASRISHAPTRSTTSSSARRSPVPSRARSARRSRQAPCTVTVVRTVVEGAHSDRTSFRSPGTSGESRLNRRFDRDCAGGGPLRIEADMGRLRNGAAAAQPPWMVRPAGRAARAPPTKPIVERKQD